MEKFKDYMAKYSSVLTIILCVVSVVAVCFGVYGCMHPAQTVTQESQQEAETPAGVEQAADRAHVPISNDQANDAATQIKYIYEHDVQPVYTITTTGSKVQKVAETAQNDAGADFSIITDKSDPNSKVDISAIPATSTVELNQYNVQAYKKVLHTVDVGTNDFRGVDEVGYMVSRKISKDGKYMGVGASYNVENKKTLVRLSYTW